MPDICESKAFEFLEILRELDGGLRARLILVMREVYFQVFELTVSTEGVIENIDVSSAGSCNLSDFELLQVLKFAKNSEYHLVHDTIHILYLKVERKVSQDVFLEK